MWSEIENSTHIEIGYINWGEELGQDLYIQKGMTTFITGFKIEESKCKIVQAFWVGGGGVKI